MVAYDFSAEPNNPWDKATWSPRAQIDFMRRTRASYDYIGGNAEARINQRIAQSDTKGMPPPADKKPPFQVIVEKRFITTGSASAGAPQAVVLGFGQTGNTLLGAAASFAVGVVPTAAVFPGVQPSEARCQTAPTDTAQLLLVTAEIETICTITFEAGSTVGTFDWASPATIVEPGDLLFVLAPAVSDATFAGINLAFIGAPAS